MNIKLVNNFPNSEWDNFVDSSNNGTIFHKTKFLNYHNKGKLIFHNLCFYNQLGIRAVLPGILKDNTFKSPGGASYGSFAVGDISFSEYETIINNFINYAKEKNINKIFLTPPPIVYLTKWNEADKFLLEYKGFQIEQDLISHAINLEKFTNKDSILKEIDKRFRNDITKSFQYNLSIQINSEKLGLFYPILLDNKKKFNTIPTHTLEELIKIKAIFPDNLILFMAYDENNRPLAGILLFICNNNTVLTFYISHYYDFHHYKAVSRLLYESLIWSKINGFKWYDLGVSMDTLSKNPMEPSRSLIFFKESMGSRGFLRTTYKIEL